MIRLSMYVMLSTWKQLVKHASKKKKPPVVLSGYSKNQDLTMFFVRIGRVFSGSRFRFLSDLDGFFRTWISDSTFGFSSDLEQLFCRIGYFKSIKTVLQVKAREHSILS